jgi:hypothetical protein
MQNRKISYLWHQGPPLNTMLNHIHLRPYCQSHWVFISLVLEVSVLQLVSLPKLCVCFLSSPPFSNLLDLTVLSSLTTCMNNSLSFIDHRVLCSYQHYLILYSCTFSLSSLCFAVRVTVSVIRNKWNSQWFVHPNVIIVLILFSKRNRRLKSKSC